MPVRVIPSGVCLFALLVLCGSATAQKIPVNGAFWPGFEAYFPFQEGARWGLYAEAYYKRVNFIANPQGFETSLGATYYLKKNENRIAAGFSYAYNHPYDESSLPYSWPDYRVWEQYMIRKTSHTNKNHLWVQRYRLEERWFERKSDPSEAAYDYTKFEVTLRAMLRSQWYIKPKFGFVLYDEVHLRLYSKERTERYLDQNRLYAGVMYALDEERRWRLETGYMIQSQFESPENEVGRERVNNIWRVTITGDIPLKK